MMNMGELKSKLVNRDDHYNDMAGGYEYDPNDFGDDNYNKNQSNKQKIDLKAK